MCHRSGSGAWNERMKGGLTLVHLPFFFRAERKRKRALGRERKMERKRKEGKMKRKKFLARYFFVYFIPFLLSEIRQETHILSEV